MADDNKYNCGQIIPSSCVPYTGKDLTFVSSVNQIKCDDNINDVIFRIDEALKKLIDGNNFTSLNKNCLDFNPATITNVELHQIEIDEICLSKGKITALEQQLQNLNIGVEIINITLPLCLQGAAAPCATGTNQYQLIALLNLFASKLCDHETRISNLES